MARLSEQIVSVSTTKLPAVGALTETGTCGYLITCTEPALAFPLAVERGVTSS